MIILSLNVRGGINYRNKPYRIIEELKDREWDIVLLQEFNHIKPKNRTLIERELNVKIYCNESKKQRSNIGVGSFIKIDKIHLFSSITYPNIIGEGRFQHLKLVTNMENIDILNIYGTTYVPHKKTQWNSLSRYIDKLNKYLIIGDFNSTIEQDEKCGDLTKKHIDEHLIKLIENHNLIDTATHKDNKTHTYYGWKCSSLLDKILFTHNIQYLIFDYLNEICPTSDHNILTINIINKMNLTKTKTKRKRYWKLNNSILLDENVTAAIGNLWDEWRLFQDNYDSLIDWYLIGKNKVRKMLMRLSKQRATLRNKEEKDITNILNHEINKPNPDIETINKLKKQYNKLIEYKIEGIKVRSRLLNFPNEEKGSKAFYNIEQRNNRRAQIDKLTLDNKQVITDNKIIDNEIFNFYSKLYSSQHIEQADIDNMLRHYNNIGDLTEQDKINLNKPFELKEIKKTIDRMNSNKSPGGDGLTKEYYQAAWEHIKYDIQSFIQSLPNIDSLPTDITTGVIKLLPKKNDLTLLKNWRPISLLNVDFKIITSLIANRLGTVLNKYIGSHQTCSVKNRYIFENLITIETILENYQFKREDRESMKGGIIMGLDMEKAFDRVEYKYIFGLLDKLELGHTISKYIRVVYTNINQKVETPTGYTNNIKLQRGIRQGCALSMALFTISIEPLLQLIISKMRGIQYKRGKFIKTLAYADDTVVMLNSHKEKELLDQIISLYQRASGAKINMEKTQELTLNNNKQDPIDILGIKFTLNNNDRTNINWEKIIDKIRNKLAPFTFRNMTLLGKATIINSIIISNIIHIARIIPPYKKHTKQINSIIANFIGSEKPVGYCVKELEKPVHKGGFGVPNVNTKVNAIILMWLHYLTTKQEHPIWLDLFRDSMRVTPNTQQNSIYHIILSFKNKQQFNWNKITSRDLYTHLNTKTVTPYQIERELANTFNWEGIWTTWAQRPISNRIKIQVHRLITKKILCEKVINKAGNCCMCDLPFNQSREHIFIGCKGTEHMQSLSLQNGFKVDENIFYDKYNSVDVAKMAYTYIVAIIKLREGHKGKWGIPSINSQNEMWHCVNKWNI